MLRPSKLDIAGLQKLVFRIVAGFAVGAVAGVVFNNLEVGIVAGGLLAMAAFFLTPFTT